MENLQKFISTNELIEYIFSVDPTHDISKIRLGLGTEQTIKFLEKFQGTTLHIPAKSGLDRWRIAYIVRKELSGINIDGPIYIKKVIMLSKMFDLPKRAIIEMKKTGRYSR